MRNVWDVHCGVFCVVGNVDAGIVYVDVPALGLGNLTKTDWRVPREEEQCPESK